MAIAGQRPLIKSTSGFTMRAMNCRAYALRLSAYLRWPSAKRVSMVKEDFPDPDTPVTTTSLLRGISTEIFFKLCTRAPFIYILSKVLGVVPANVDLPVVTAINFKGPQIYCI